jgi:hypothetical protein
MPSSLADTTGEMIDADGGMQHLLIALARNLL